MRHERLAQFIDVETREPGNNRGVRLFAPTKECFKRKKVYVKHKFTSMKFKTIRLAAIVAARKKGKQEVTKVVDTAVGSNRVVEIIMENMESNRKNGRFRSAEKRYNVPVPWEGETALYKIGADGGAGSNKHTANPVNVDNPQGQEHVYPFLEFSGAKDSYNNLKRVYEEHPEMKRDVEDLMRRKMSYVEVTIGKQVGSCIAINTDAGHDYKNPKPLPDLAKDIVVVASASSSSQPYPKSQPLEKYAVHIDFSKVKSTKLIRNQSQNCYEGLMFQDEDGKHIGTSLFKTPVMCTSSDHDRHDCKMNQVLLMGVLASDLQLLCTLFGHQGASAMWFCLFCLLKQSQSKDEFEGKAHETIQRTLESITKDAQQFKAAFDGASQQEKNKSTFKSNLTQTCSHSITDTPLLDIPLDCITYATMHVVLGLTKWLVDLTIAGYTHIEKKAALTDEGKKQVAFGETIELALEKARRYKDFLTEQLKDAKAAVASQHTVAARITELAEELEEVQQLIDEDFSYTDDSELGQRQAQILAELEQLGGQVQSEMQSANNSGEGDDIDYLQMLLEQICITNENIDELEEYLNNHGSHSARVVDAVLKRNGVDQATYFKGAIIGNHCMTFAAFTVIA